MKHIVICTLLSVLAGCGGQELEPEGETTSEVETSEVETPGCRGKAYSLCVECIGIHCSFEQCAPTATHFWRGQQNNNRARCEQLVSNWAPPKACKGLPILAYKYWFRTTSGEEGEFGPAGCSY